MNFARRNRSIHGKGTRSRAAQRTSSTHLPQLDTLEQRILMAGSVLDAVNITWNGRGSEAARNQYLVTSPLGSAQAVFNYLGSQGLRPSAVKSLAFNGLGSQYYLVVDSQTPLAALNWYAVNKTGGMISSIAPNFINRMHLTPAEAQPGLADWASELWHIRNDGSLLTTDIFNQNRQAVVGADINMLNAWDLGTGGAGANDPIIAVLDTGVAIDHPDLALNIFNNTGDPVDGVDNDGNGVIDDQFGANFTTLDANDVILPDNVVTDAVGHGTHVAGIMGAVGQNMLDSVAEPDGQVYDYYIMPGMNWRTRILPVKVLDDTGAGTDAMILAGINYVTYMKQILGHNIVSANLSLGRAFAGPQSGLGDPTLGVPAVFTSLQQLNAAGVITTLSAGNDAWSIGEIGGSPASYRNSLSFTVAATDASDQLSNFSSFGGAATIAAPGTNILSTLSFESTEPDIYGQPPHNPYARRGYAIFNGTSMAAPMVAGAAALLKSMVPGASPQQIVNAIYAGADVLPQLQGRVTTSSRLDVFRAAQILLGNRPVIGNVEVNNGKTVAGWAFDPNMGSKQVSGYVLVDGVTAIPFVTDIQRPDVDRVVYNDEGRRRSNTARGWSVDIGNVVGPGQHLIQVFFNDTFQVNGVITNPDGSFIAAPWLVHQRVVESNQMPIGNVDIISADQFAGWAWDPNSNGVPIQVRIDIDGNQVAVVPADQFHSTQVGNQGFFYTPNLSQGYHRVDIYAIDDFTGTPVLIGTRTVYGNKGIQWTDLAYNGQTRLLSGYVVDPDSTFDPVSMQIIIDGQNGQRQYYEAVANLDDPTKANFLNVPGNTLHKFAITLPNFTPGNHQVTIYAYDNETGQRVELLAPALFANQVPTGELTANAGAWEGRIIDPNSPGQDLYYRIDIDGQIGQVTLTDDGFTDGSVAFSLVPPPLLAPGNHTLQLWALDAQTLQLTLIDTVTVPVGNSGQATGAIDAPGIGVGLPITGFAQDTAGTAQTFVNVNLYAADPSNNNVPVLIATKPANIARAQGGQVGFSFGVFEIRDALAFAFPDGRGIWHLEVRAEDIQDPTVETLLGQGEFQVGNANSNVYYSGSLTDLNFVTLNGAAQGTFNDFDPKFVIDINNEQFVRFETDPAALFAIDPFTVRTPQLRGVANNVVRLRYMNPVSGVLEDLATQNLPPTPVNAFVNQRLIATGNFLPAGNIDAASQNGIAGWVRDADQAGTPILYRLDYDNNIGIPKTASDLRGDLPFRIVANDQNHGFSIVPPLLSAGAHTVKLWAIDPVTLQAVLVTQRSFTVTDDANRRPFGAVDILNGSRIAGWVQDPTTPGWSIGIELRVDGVVVGMFPASTPRPDVNRNGAFATGFDFAMPAGVAPGRHVVEVYAMDSTQNGRKVLLRSASVEVGTPLVSGTVEAANFAQIAGWGRAAANDPSPKFRLDVNGVPFQTFSGTASTIPGEAGLNLLRFAFTTPPLGVTSNNTVTLHYIDPITREAVLLSTVVIGPIRPTTGSVDVANTSVIQGWAWSPSLPDAIVQVQLIIDNVEVAVTPASLQRPDLTGQLAGHAFQFNVPTLAPGRHVFSVRFRDPVTGDYSLVTSNTLVIA